MSIKMKTKRETKLENGTGEDIIVSLVSDGFKIKLSDLGPEGVYPITTDKDASRREYAIALADPRECDSMVITSEDLADSPKVTIYIKPTAKLDWSPEGRARETDDSASPIRPTPIRMATELENRTVEDIIVNSVLRDGSKIKLGDVKPGEVYTIIPDITAKYVIALADLARECEPAFILGDALAVISKVTIDIKRAGKLDWSPEGTRSSGFFKRLFRTGN